MKKTLIALLTAATLASCAKQEAPRQITETAQLQTSWEKTETALNTEYLEKRAKEVTGLESKFDIFEMNRNFPPTHQYNNANEDWIVASSADQKHHVYFRKGGTLYGRVDKIAPNTWMAQEISPEGPTSRTKYKKSENGDSTIYTDLLAKDKNWLRLWGQPGVSESDTKYPIFQVTKKGLKDTKKYENVFGGESGHVVGNSAGLYFVAQRQTLDNDENILEQEGEFFQQWKEHGFVRSNYIPAKVKNGKIYLMAGPKIQQDDPSYERAVREQSEKMNLYRKIVPKQLQGGIEYGPYF